MEKAGGRERTWEDIKAPPVPMNGGGGLGVERTPELASVSAGATREPDPEDRPALWPTCTKTPEFGHAW